MHNETGFRRLRLALSFMKGTVWYYVGSVAAVAVNVGIGFLTPLILAETIDAIIGQKRPLAIPGILGQWVEQLGGREFLAHNLWIMGLAMLLLSILGGVLQFLRGKWMSIASEGIAKTMRDNLYSHLQRLSYNYHVKAETGDLIQRCTSDVETIRRFISSQVVELFRAVLMIVVALVIMLGMNVKMTLMSMVLVPVLFAFAYVYFKFVVKYFRLTDEAEGKMSAVLQENLTGVRVVRAFGREQYEVEKFKKANDDLHAKGKKVTWLLAVYWSGSDCLSMTQSAITLIFGMFMAAKGEILVGEMTIFVSYISMLLWPIRQMGRILSDLGKSMVAFDRIEEIIKTPAETEDDDVTDAPIDRDIEFRHVGFEYESNNPVLKDVNFTVKAGQTVAILGATGSGKSTLMHLLQRLYEVKRGDILIGGVSIKKIRKEHLRSRIGLVLQEPFLYSRSVRDNVRIVKPTLDDEAVFDATRTAAAHEFIEGFEKGYDTAVGERGVTLSGGQKQRVAIARTLLKDNDILIFDDSLSAVDTQTDAQIRKALKEKRKGMTTFIISHRLTTLMEADFIVVLDGGIIAQQGTHEELVQQEGLYKKIYNIQTSLEDELKNED